MKLQKDHISRCGLFLFFDKQGVVDEYISQMLKDLQEHVDYLLVICNGYVNQEGLKKLRGCSSEVLCRANVGFDVGGYREGLFYLGWKRLQEYDELVLMNYTFFGPLYPFSDMFAEMEEKDVDFWGVTKYHKVDPDPFQQISYGFLPEHIQSHLIVLRPSLFMSYQYRDFMMNRTNPTSYTEAICSYEAIFTKYFSDLGFTWDVYVDTEEFEGYVYYPVIFRAKEVIEKTKCPIIKRRSFFTNYDDFLLNTCGESSSEVYDYLRTHNLYDLNLIWDNILRLENLTDIHRNLHLNYMLESYDTDYAWGEKTALVIFIDGISQYPWFRDYLSQIPEGMDIYLYGTEEDCNRVKARLRGKNTVKAQYMEASYTERLSMAAEDLKDAGYAYVGVAHMMNPEDREPYSDTLSWQKADWENLFGNEAVMGNLLGTFGENPRMGTCVPPKPVHGSLFAKTQGRWCGKLEQVKAYLKAWEIPVNISPEENPPAPLGGSFWIRGGLLEKAAEFLSNTEEETALLVLPLVLQHLGFYTGVAYSDRYAPASVTNQDYMLRENNKVLFKKYGATYHVMVRYRIQINDMQYGEEWMEPAEEA